MAEPFRINIDAGEVVDLAEAWRVAPDIVVEELSRSILESELLAEREVKEVTPAATGTLRESIFSKEPMVLADQVIGVVGTSMAYALPVELGTKPHFPPVQALADWARLKLGVDPEDADRVGYLIARKIAAVGTEGAAMFSRGFASIAGQVETIHIRALERIKSRLVEMAP